MRSKFAHLIQNTAFVMKMNLLFPAVAIAFAIVGCNTTPPEPEKLRTPMGVEIDNPAGHSREFIAEIEKPIRRFLDAQNSGSGEELADSFFDIVWIENNRDNFILYAGNYEKMGMKNHNDTFEIRYLSPVVDTLGMQFVSLRYYSEARLWFTDKFVGDPATYMVNLKSIHGENNVTYDAEKQTYYYKGERVGHAAKYTEDTEWKYLEDDYNRRVSSAIVPTEMYLKIRNYAKYE